MSEATMTHLCLNCKLVGSEKQFASTPHLSYFHCPSCPKNKRRNVVPLYKAIDFYIKIKKACDNEYGQSDIGWECLNELRPDLLQD